MSLVGCPLLKIPQEDRISILLENACMRAKLLQSCPTLCNPMDCSPPGYSVHGICQAGILEWVAISSSRGSSRPRGLIQGLLHCRQILLSVPPGKPLEHKGGRGGWELGRVQTARERCALMTHGVSQSVCTLSSSQPPSPNLILPLLP